MFVTELAKKIETWRGDSALFIETPLSGRTISRGKTVDRVHQIANLIKHTSIGCKPAVGFCFEDGANWVISAIGTQVACAVAVPIPKEFTSAQISSFVPNLDLVLTDSRELAKKLSSLFGPNAKFEMKEVEGETLYWIRSGDARRNGLRLPSNAVGVIHTSGSTDNPKGVVIGDEGLQSVVRSMGDRLKRVGKVRYASVLPMSLLLEQILGIYIPLFTDGSVAVLPPSVPCYTGTQEDLAPYLMTIKESRANFSMVPPSFLTELAKRSTAGSPSTRDQIGADIEVLATGGAPIEPATLERLKSDGLEVFQGYGLSENTSVVAWTYPGPNLMGSVGKPLSHNEVRINEEGQVEVRGSSVFLGYVSRGEFKLRNKDWLTTGDNGYFDDEGGLHITGRDSNLIVLSSGRNVAPEWVEGKFKSIPCVKDVLLVGHGRPFLSVIVLVNQNFECEEAMGIVREYAEKINSELPEFSRVQAIRALPFDDRYYSVSGRVLRKHVMETHSAVVDEIYSSKKA